MVCRSYRTGAAVSQASSPTVSKAGQSQFRYKALIGSGLRARSLPAQKTEARVGCAVLNQMNGLGMPVSQRIT